MFVGVAASGRYHGGPRAGAGSADARYAGDPLRFSGIIERHRSELGITKDGSNKVSQWNDLSTSAFNLLQATGANQPTWSSSVPGNVQPGLTFPASTSVLQHTNTLYASQPATLVFAVRTDGIAAPEVVYDYTGSGSREFFQIPTSTIARGNAGASLDNTSGTWSNRNLVLVFVPNGASSETRVNGNVATGNAGTNGLTNGISIGNVSSAGQPFGGYIQGIVIYNRLLSDSEIYRIEHALIPTYNAA